MKSNARGGPRATVRDAIIHVFPDSETFGQHFAHATQLQKQPVTLHHFPDGETLVRVQEPIGQHAILVRSLHHPNAKLLEVLFAADALRRAGAREITLVSPYLPYMRQDTVFTPGEPISQYVIGDVLHRAFDRVLTIEAHLHRTRQLSDVIAPSAKSISAAPVIGRWVQQTGTHSLIVGPDAESEPWVHAVARVAQCRWVVGHKQRLGDHRVEIRFPALPECSRAVIVDDIASSGATIGAAARALRRAGCAAVDAVVVHAIFAPGALTRITRAGVRTMVSCDTIPHPTNAIGVAALLAKAISHK